MKALSRFLSIYTALVMLAMAGLAFSRCLTDDTVPERQVAFIAMLISLLIASLSLTSLERK